MYVATAQAQQVNSLKYYSFNIILYKLMEFSSICLFLLIFLGLTVSLSRDAGTGDYALEAGALVLADQGKNENGNTGLKVCLCLLYMHLICMDLM